MCCSATEVSSIAYISKINYYISDYLYLKFKVWMSLSEKDILKFLQNLGFSKREVQVYMFLDKSGAQSTSFVAKRLKMERVQAYRTFKKLQEKGFIEATLERPTRFTVVPFESLLEAFIETKRGEVESLNSQKENMLTSWRSVSAPETDYTVSKFLVISGKKKIHAKMLSMIGDTQKGAFLLTTNVGLVQEDLGGVFDTLIHTARRSDAEFKVLADITPENLKIAEQICRRFPESASRAECRHLGLSSRFFPRFLIKDEEEAILYASNEDEASVLNIEDEGLWINDKMFISVLKAFFVQMWQIGVNASSRIEELKTGIPIGETKVIKDAAEAWAKVEQLLENAKKDVIMITSSQSLLSFLEKDPFAKHHKEGLKFRLMAPIDLDNLDAAQKLSAHYEIKHVPINYMTMLLIDDKNLFMFKSPPISDLAEESFYTTDTFYTNDLRSIDPVHEMLNDTWKRGMDLSEITQQTGMKLPSIAVSMNDKVSKLVNAVLRNNVNSVLICEKEELIGIINDRDVLREVAENKKDPEKALVKDLDYTPLLRLYSSQTMTDALKIMQEKKLKRVAVVKDGQLMGMLVQPLRERKGGAAAAKRSSK
jgi:sugar-specific transcriptional regulator TrmB/CBS domain-containing protein